MHDNVAKTQFQWHFIPPSSSHCGGLSKAGVEPLKYLWRRTIGEALLTFDKFNTLVIQIDVCLNICLRQYRVILTILPI